MTSLADDRIFAIGSFIQIGDRPSFQLATYAPTHAPGTGQPVISQQPVDVAACRSGSGKFSVAAEGPPTLQYQWQLEETPAFGGWINVSDNTNVLSGGRSFSPIGGARMTDLIIVQTGIGLGAATRFRCIVSNGCGSVITNVATLLLPPPCSLADVAGTENLVEFSGGSVVRRCADGVVDGTDFIAFINSFSLQNRTIDPLADVAGGGPDGLRPDGTIDGTDFIEFINAFSVGC
jgi:hypothetical protein